MHVCPAGCVCVCTVCIESLCFHAQKCNPLETEYTGRKEGEEGTHLIPIAVVALVAIIVFFFRRLASPLTLPSFVVVVVVVFCSSYVPFVSFSFNFHFMDFRGFGFLLWLVFFCFVFFFVFFSSIICFVLFFVSDSFISCVKKNSRHELTANYSGAEG